MLHIYLLTVLVLEGHTIFCMANACQVCQYPVICPGVSKGSGNEKFELKR